MAIKGNEIRVSKRIKAISNELRKPIELVLGYQYYIATKKSVVVSCRLVDIYESSEGIKMITVKIRMDNNNPNEYERHAFFDEIGRTPEEAMMHSHFFN